MTNEQLTYMVVAVCGVLVLAAYVALVLVPAWTSYSRVSERIVVFHSDTARRLRLALKILAAVVRGEEVRDLRAVKHP